MTLPPLFAKTVSLLRRASDFVPPTWRGILLAAAAGLALWLYGFGHLDVILYVTGICAVVLLVTASLLVGGAAIVLKRRVEAPPAAPRRLEAGSPIATGWSLPALGWLPLVKVRWEWVTPGGVDVRVRERHGRLVEEAFAVRRGQAGHVRRRVTVEDAFGLTRVAWTAVDPSPVTVLPAAGGLRQMPVIQSLAAREGLPHPSGAPEGDRMEIRRYQPGDSVRHILWKTFARTRQLNVRVPELAIDRSQKTIAYLVAGDDDEATAAAARVALEDGALGEDWLFGADGTAAPVDLLEPALDAIARSGSIVAEGGRRPPSGLAGFLRQAGRQGEAHCVVFVPPRPGAWVADVLQAARGYPGAMSFVIGTDGVRRDPPRPLWRRLLFAAPRLAGTPQEELSRVLGELGSVAPAPLVVDRASGRAYGEARHRRALGG